MPPVRLLIVRILLLPISVLVATVISASAQAGESQPPLPQPVSGVTPTAPQQPERQPPGTPRRPRGQIRLGALWLTPSVSLKEIGIDTNVFNSGSADDRHADFTWTAGPELSLLVDRRRGQLEAAGGVDYVYFQESVSERSFQFSANVGGSFNLTRRIQFVGDTSDATTRQRFSPEVDLRAKRRTRSVSAGANIGLSRKLSLEMRARASERRFDNGAIYNDVALADTLNEDLRSSGASLGLRLTPWTKLSFGGTASAYRLPLTPAKDADAEEYTVRAQMNPKALISGDVQVGRIRYVTRAAGVPDFDGITMNSAIGLELGENTSFRATMGRQVGLSYQSNVAFIIDNRYGGTLQQTFSRVQLALDAYNYLYQYRGFIPLHAGELPPGDERLERFALRLTIRAVGELRVGLHSEYSHRVSESNLRLYEGFRYWTSISYGRLSVKDHGAPYQGR